MAKQIDFIWSSKKEYNALYPLYDFFKSKNSNPTKLIKIHRNKFVNFIAKIKISHYVIISHSHTYYRLINYGWKGEFIYVDHGISPIKYYSYAYDFFFKSSLLFYPGKIFEKKMNTISKQKFKKGLLGGFPIADDLYKIKINKKSLVKKYNLDSKKPIILFAPTWGSKKDKLWGLNNLKHLTQIDNLITIPHPSDYIISKKIKNVIIPHDRNELNEILHLSDIIISDISSILLEGSMINKNTIQLILKKYPGTFPNIDLDDDKIIVSKKVLQQEIKNTDLNTRPFKISFLDEEMIVDYTSTLKNIEETIKEVIKNPDRNLKSRQYWVDQCCFNFDGKTNERIYNMIINFIENGDIKQLY